VTALAEPVIHYRLHPGQFSVTALERQALGFLSVRAAAVARRRGEDDPLRGVAQLDERALARLGIRREELDETIVSDAVQWAATLGRVGRDAEAAALLEAASSLNGAPSRTTLARRARRLTLKRALRHLRVGEAARELTAYARGR
jgi:hypothetical protein